ncbi:winged helix-turn-helix transcriptional regulator [Populibacterium corticicola]|jgi:DNA-binding HxlR family transcriptional regulator|uniref:Winged helix-turn-helix transcriptional regulator n=1 Tax=Populibacterium corticicola TaxID=1812826 RepID=A0ABW5XFE9_9MICO
MTSLDWNPYARNCPTRELLNRIGDRWTVLIIGTLNDGPRRFNEIARAVEGISQKMLTQTLRALERDGLVTRTIYAQIPPKVEYALTDLGVSLREPLKELELWATTHMEQVLAARLRADQAPEQEQ